MIFHAMRVSLTLFLIIIFLSGCKQDGDKKISKHIEPETPELLIYCENGMVSPILEISNYFESQYKCKIRIHNDCSKNLIGLINYSQKGDLFIPDCYQAIASLSKSNPTIISDSLFIGVNKLVFIVKKGNPESFDGTLFSLCKKKHAVLLANPETSSLGFETKKLFKQKNIYDSIMTNVLALSVDSRGITRSVINGEASVGVDWLSSYYYNSNKILTDTICINTEYEIPRVYASALRSSKNPGLARTFLATISSEYGSDIFAKYGIKKRKITIF